MVSSLLPGYNILWILRYASAASAFASRELIIAALLACLNKSSTQIRILHQHQHRQQTTAKRLLFVYVQLLLTLHTSMHAFHEPCLLVVLVLAC
jgi:hypothetical protein